MNKHHNLFMGNTYFFRVWLFTIWTTIILVNLTKYWFRCNNESKDPSMQYRPLVKPNHGMSRSTNVRTQAQILTLVSHQEDILCFIRLMPLKLQLTVFWVKIVLALLNSACFKTNILIWHLLNFKEKFWSRRMDSDYVKPS